MSIATITERKGDPKELLKQYDEVSAQVMALDRQPGHLSHSCLELPDGIRIVNTFDSEEHAREFSARPEFQEIFAKAGIPPTAPQVFRIHNSITLG